jgi:hypothetical protein
MAQTCTWMGDSGVNTNWSNDANWHGSVENHKKPVAGDTAIFNNAVNCTIDATSACAVVDTTGFTGTISANANLTTSGNLTFGAGTTYTFLSGRVLDIGGTFVANGTSGSHVTINATLPTLVAHWKCNDNAATTAVADSSGNGYNGVWSRNTSNDSVVGKLPVGSPLALYPNTANYGVVTDNNAFSFGNGTTDSPFSVAGWIKLDGNQQNRGIIGKRINGVGVEWNIEVGYGESNTVIRFNVFDDSAGAHRGRITGNTSTNWQHIVCTYNGDNTNPSAGIKIYVNGVRSDTTSTTNGSYTAMENTAVNVWLGGQYSTSNLLDGSIDDLRVYSGELTQTDVSAIYNAGTGTENEISAVGYLYAASLGTITYVDASNVYSNGVGYSLSFNGTNETLSIANESNFDFERTDAFSIEAWVNPASGYTYIPIFDKLDSSAPLSGYEFRVGWASGDGKFYTLLCNNYAGENRITKFSTNAVVTTGVWNHVVMTKSTASNAAGITFYVNGVAITDTTTTFDGLTASMKNNITPYIASRNNASLFGKANIDEVVVYNKTLSAAEVLASYNSGVGLDHTSTTNVVGGWHFDDGTGTTADDWASTNDGTFVNTPDWTVGGKGNSTPITTVGGSVTDCVNWAYVSPPATHINPLPSFRAVA